MDAPRPPAPSMEEIVERLSEMGLQTIEARVYMHLLKAGPTKAGELARVLNAARGEVYRVLQGLVEREVITSSLSRPVMFKAVQPNELFEGLIAKERRRISRLEQAQQELGSTLERIRSSPVEALTAPTFRMLHGRHVVAEAVDGLIARASREVLVLDTHPAASRLGVSLGLAATSRERIEDGVRFRVLLADTAQTRDAVAQRGPDERLRLAPAGAHGRLVIVDERVAIVGVVTDPSTRTGAEGDVVLWSDSIDFVRLQRALFDALWAQSPVPPLPQP